MLQGAKDDGQVRAGLFAKTVSYAHEGDLKSAQLELEKQYALGEKTGDVLAMSGDLALMGNLAIESGDAAGAEMRYRRALEIVEVSPSVPEVNKENLRRLASFRAARAALVRNDRRRPWKRARSSTRMSPTRASLPEELAHDWRSAALAESR